MNRKHMADTFRPGDIWRHNNGMGNLAVTGEQRFQLTWGQFKALKKIVKELDG